MKCITVSQPYAHLISLPDDHPEAKRVENRTWTDKYRGPIAIHAGKGLTYLHDDDWELWPNMAFGAIVAVAHLATILRVEEIATGFVLHHYPFLTAHKHIEGPYCWVLTSVRRLATPVECPGKRGLWDLPKAVAAKALAEVMK